MESRSLFAAASAHTRNADNVQSCRSAVAGRGGVLSRRSAICGVLDTFRGVVSHELECTFVGPDGGSGVRRRIDSSRRMDERSSSWSSCPWRHKISARSCLADHTRPPKPRERGGGNDLARTAPPPRCARAPRGAPQKHGSDLLLAFSDSAFVSSCLAIRIPHIDTGRRRPESGPGTTAQRRSRRRR